MGKIHIPVAVFGFNRPDKLRESVRALRNMAPDEVWLFIDGPRADRPNEKELCDQVASVASDFDWGCKLVVRKNIANKGLRAQIRDGLTEFFANHPAGLIMEDDVCFSSSAADYVNQVVPLIDGKTVAAASLNNFLIPGRSAMSAAIREQGAPYISRLFHCWGWVTTREGWSLYQDDIEHECDDNFFAKVVDQFSGFQHPAVQWKPIVGMLHRGLQSWACRYQLSLWKAGAKCIVPPINLATNIGMGGEATHTHSAPEWMTDWLLEDGAIRFDLSVADNVDCDIDELSMTEKVAAHTHCRFCHHPAHKVFTRDILGVPRNFYECQECGSLQTSNPTWLDQAYSDNISVFDTGVMLRNLNNFVLTKNVANVLAYGSDLKLLEFGAGSGMLTRMLRDTGLDAYAYDVHNAPSLAGGFVPPDLNTFVEQNADKPKLILAFEVFEHFTDPEGSLKALFESQADALLVTTDLYVGQDSNWTYLTPFSGQHVFFYSHKALSQVADRYGYDLVSEGNTHLFLSRQRLAEGVRQNNRAWQEALRHSIYGDGGLNRFVSHMSNVSGVMRDYNDLIAKHYKAPQYVQPRIYLNRQDSKKLYIDCVFYQMASTGIAKLWNEVFRIWGSRYGDRVVLLDRGGEIEDYGLPREKMPRFQFNDPTASIRGLSWQLMRNGAHSLLSTYYTFCEHLPTRAVVYDMIPESLGFTGPEWDLKRAYLQRASAAHSISRTSHEALVKSHPHLADASFYRLTGISPVFKPVNSSERSGIRQQLGVERPMLFVLPCSLGGYKDGLTALKAAAMLPFADQVEIIGTVPPPDAEAISQMFPQLRIRFMRFASDGDFARLMGAADLVLWPSQIEGIGYPPMESIASGTRMVCCRNDINQEVYGHEAVYAEVGNPVSFASAITQALSAPLNPKLTEIVSGVRDYERYAEELFNFGFYGHPQGASALVQPQAA
jgi:glycosyltransferase involved in cell wall biosynthesis